MTEKVTVVINLVLYVQPELNIYKCAISPLSSRPISPVPFCSACLLPRCSFPWHAGVLLHLKRQSELDGPVGQEPYTQLAFCLWK